MENWLVVNGCHEFYIFPWLLGISSSQLTHSYFSGVAQPPTRKKISSKPWDWWHGFRQFAALTNQRRPAVNFLAINKWIVSMSCPRIISQLNMNIPYIYTYIYIHIYIYNQCIIPSNRPTFDSSWPSHENIPWYIPGPIGPVLEWWYLLMIHLNGMFL